MILNTCINMYIIYVNCNLNIMYHVYILGSWLFNDLLGQYISLHYFPLCCFPVNCIQLYLYIKSQLLRKLSVCVVVLSRNCTLHLHIDDYSYMYMCVLTRSLEHLAIVFYQNKWMNVWWAIRLVDINCIGVDL